MSSETNNAIRFRLAAVLLAIALGLAFQANGVFASIGRQSSQGATQLKKEAPGALVLGSTPTDTPTNALTVTITPSGTPTSTLTTVPTDTPTATPTGTQVVCSIEFQDVPPDHQDYDSIHCVSCQGSMDNFPCGQPGEPCVPPNNYAYFRPSAMYSGMRAELCKLVVIAARWPIDTSGGPHFVDVPQCDPYYPYIETAFHRGIVSGYADGTFRPYDGATRGQFAKVLVLAAGWPLDTSGGPHFSDVDASSIFYAFIETAHNHNAATWYGCGGSGEPCPGLYYRPGSDISTMTRAEIARVTAHTFSNCVINTTPTPTPISNPCTPTSTPTITATNTPTSTPTNTTTPTSTLTPIPFRDVSSSDYFYEGVRYLSSRGVISGYNDGMFKPYDEATRAQVTKIVVLALGWQLVCPSVAHFSDVPVGDVFYCFVETAYAHGIINGYDGGTFQPSTNITRAQLCKVVVLAMNWPTDTSGGPHFVDVPQDDPFYEVIETAVHRGIISGYEGGLFRPNDNTTRGQICKIVYGAIRNP